MPALGTVGHRCPARAQGRLAATLSTACWGLSQGTTWVPIAQTGAGLPRSNQHGAQGTCTPWLAPPWGRAEAARGVWGRSSLWLLPAACLSPGVPHPLVPAALPSLGLSLRHSAGSEEPQNPHEQLLVGYGWILTHPPQPLLCTGDSQDPQSLRAEICPLGSV